MKNIMNDYDFFDEVPLAEEYCELRVLCELSPKDVAVARSSLSRCVFSTIIRHDGLLIAMGRIVGDGGLHVQIVDIMVHPDYRGKKLSHVIMQRLMEYIHTSVPSCAFVNLFADINFLYSQYGFKNYDKGMGMYLLRSK